MYRSLVSAALCAAFVIPASWCRAAPAGAELAGQKWQVQTRNPLDAERKNALVCLPLERLQGGDGNYVVIDDDSPLPSAPYDCDGDSTIDSLAALADFAPGERKNLTVYSGNAGFLGGDYGFVGSRKTYAELLVRLNGIADDEGKLQKGALTPVSRLQLPPHHTVGNRLLKYEGPGWESEQVGYRLYFDKRSAIDIFGKTKEQLVLSRVGLDGGDYHSLSDWGMDILKVGNSLGLGGLGLWSGRGLEGVNDFAAAKVEVRNSDIASGVDVQYTGWKAASGARDLTMQIRILPGSRLTRVSARSDSAVPAWATGMVRHGLTPTVSAEKNSTWDYLATWGKQSLAEDDLGMAVFFRRDDLLENKNDPNNHLALLRGGKAARYYFAAVWRDQGIEREEDFIAYLNIALDELNNPIEVRIEH